MSQINIYTDGGCFPNPNGRGAWAYAGIQDGRLLFEGSGSEASTTNNRMEMCAILFALQDTRFHHVERITIMSDSMYVINGMTIWRRSWAQKKKKSIKNKDLWNALWDAHDNVKNCLMYRHVKAHSGNRWNDYVDGICSQIISEKRNKKILQETAYLDFRFEQEAY